MSLRIFIIVTIFLALTIALIFYFKRLENKIIKKDLPLISTMKITSPVFNEREKIPSKYTCDGENINPALQISGVPENAKSLVLIVDDPDATRGWTWLHWTVWNINPETKEIAENSVPEGTMEGKTDFSKPGYGGPCPPSGIHRYFFKLFALDVVLDLPGGASLDELQKAMEKNILAQTELIGLYGRE